jgi:hypothetical protein
MRASRIDHSAMPPRERWRDVAAAYLVHLGLQLAGPRTRHDIATHLAAELRADVAERLRETVAARLAPARAPQDVLDAARARAIRRTG